MHKTEQQAANGTPRPPPQRGRMSHFQPRAGARQRAEAKVEREKPREPVGKPSGGSAQMELLGDPGRIQASLAALLRR